MTDYKVQLRYEDSEYEKNGGDATSEDEHFTIKDGAGRDAAVRRAREQSEYEVDYVVDVSYIPGTSR